MAEEHDYYDLLGISKDASDSDIKRAYRKMSKKYHPDINKEPGAEAKFKEINEAYETLSDGQKRAAYDQYGKAGVNGAGAGGFGEGFGGGDFSGFGDFGDIFSQFFGGGGQANRANAPRQGADLQYRMDLEFNDAIFGTETTIKYHRQGVCETCHGNGAAPGSSPVTCGKCHGSGVIEVEQPSPLGRIRTRVTCDRCEGRGKTVDKPCPTCHGVGHHDQSHEVKIKVPAGVENGNQMRLNNQGEAGENGGPYGDLFIVFRVKPSDKFTRDGATIYSTLPLSFAQAALGAELDVETVHGHETLKVPSGTQTGTEFKLKGKGAPFLRGNGNGDQIVTVKVITPKKLNDKQREALHEFAKASGEQIKMQNGSFFDRLRGK